MSGDVENAAIVWLRRDLRLRNHPALAAAVASGKPVICVYIRDTGDARRAPGAASNWWLHHSLAAFGEGVAELGGRLILRSGDPMKVLTDLVDEADADAVYWTRRYEKPARDLDTDIKQALKDRGVEVESFNGSLLTEPWTVKTGSGGHYRVFTPYWKSVRADYTAPDAIAAPEGIVDPGLASETLEDWALTPVDPDWASEFSEHWTPGETGALDRLDTWLTEGLGNYGEGRNRPDVEWSTSGLSPHLAHGEISPVTIWRTVRQAMQDGRRNIPDDDAWTFLSEIAWREFSYVLLYHYPDMASENYNSDFRHMPWREDDEAYRAWTRGCTGFPVVDAGMRQLWATGWMHNRVRMIVASFLTKHLLLPWQMGEDWFWDTLVDADPASNAAGWQWTAGSGADAAPYFRVFNPITQGQKFDATGEYVRRWIPELAKLPTKHIHAPWDAPVDVLKSASVRLGETYPNPVIEHKEGRERALDAYNTLKERRDAA